jgi:hypothetical protein
MTCKDRIYSAFEDEKLRTFLDFVLGEYVKEGVAELDQGKLPQLLALKYRAVNDAARRKRTRCLQLQVCGIARSLAISAPFCVRMGSNIRRLSSRSRAP